MVEISASSGELDQILHSVASDLGLHYLPITLSGVSRLQLVKGPRNIALLSMGARYTY